MSFTLLPTTSAFATNHVFLSLLFSLLLSHAGAQPVPPDTAQYRYARLTPAMAIVIVVLVAVLFFLAFFSLYIRHCANPSSGAASLRLRNAGDPGRSRRLNRGLEPSVIATFPTLVYSQVKGLKIGKGALECAVCLNEFEDHETLRFIPKCEHVFHPDCIDVWLASHTTCPVCRANLVPEPGESASQLNELHVELQEPCSEEDEPLAPPPPQAQAQVQPPPQQPQPILELNGQLNRNRTRGSRSGRPRGFPRSHSTGHSLVRPGENTDRFTLRLPAEVRQEIMSKRLGRATSLSEFPRQGSSRQGYRGNYSFSRRLDESDREVKSERWGFGKVGPFLSRMSSSFRSLSMKSRSIRSPKVAAESGEGTSAPAVEPTGRVGLARLPV